MDSVETRKLKTVGDNGKIFYVDDSFIKRIWSKDLGYIIVFSGSRGSGKTLSMTYFGLNFLLKRLPVWSNYTIKFPFMWPNGEIERFESLPLDMNALYTFDSGLREGVVLIDEVNLWASNRRSMSVANRLLNSVMTLIRKRKLTFMFTCQNYQWLDSQLRWQTDALILCHDQHYSYPQRYPEPGQMISQTWRDMSGIYTGRPYHETGKEYYQFFLAKPYWGCYDSWQEFDVVDASRSVIQLTDKKVIDYRAKSQLLNDTGAKSISEVLEELRSHGLNQLTSSEAKEFLDSQGFNIDSRYIGRLMKRAGYTYKQTRQGNLYVL